jgi:hypothetical protein
MAPRRWDRPMDRRDRAVSETSARCFRELATSHEGCIRPPLAKRILYQHPEKERLHEHPGPACL